MRLFKRSQPPTLSEASSQLNERLKLLDGKIDSLNMELGRIKGVDPTLANPIIKRRVTVLLQARKVYEQQREEVVAAMLNVDISEHTEAKIKTAVFLKGAYKHSLKGMKRDLRKINLDHLEKLQDDVEELHAQGVEISDSLGRSYEILEAVDDEELEREFSQLQAPRERVQSLSVTNASIPEYLSNSGWKEHSSEEMRDMEELEG